MVLITNAARRIGRALALGFAARGWDVAAHFSTAEAEANALVMTIHALGRRAVALQADLAIEAQVVRLVSACTATLGRPTCIINNATCSSKGSALNIGYDTLQSIMAINVGALLVLARTLYEAVPADAATNENLRGVVINLLGQKLYDMNPDQLSYPLLKSALQTATVTLAQALAPKVRVTGLASGFILPDCNEAATSCAPHPLTPRSGSRPDDIVAAAYYLANAASVTGTMLVVDGGQHLIPLPRDVI